MNQGINDTKKNVINTSLRLFKEKGYQNVTIDEICSTAGISKSTFYYYFKTKDGLLDDFYDIESQIGIDQIESFITSNNRWEQFWNTIEPFVDHTINAGPEIISQLFIANLQTDRNTFSPENVNTRIPVAIIKKGQEEGHFNNSSDAEEIYSVIKNTIIGIAVIWCIEKGSFDEKEAIRKALISILDVKNG